MRIDSKIITFKSEVWLPIEGFEFFYEVSNMGRVKRLKSFTRGSRGGKKIVQERILKQANTHGYRLVMLTVNGSRKNRLAHRLVAKAFIINPENKPQVNHKDGIKSNNIVDNLEWVTAKENEFHKAHSLQIISTPTNLKNVTSVNPPIKINGKTVVGKLIQKLYLDLIGGKIVSSREVIYGRIYGQIYRLRNDFGVDVKGSHIGNGFKEYYV